MNTKRTERLTLYDRLSHLTYKQACDILGTEGAPLLRQAFPLDGLDVEKDVSLDENAFHLTVHGVNVCVTLTPGAKHKLAAFCESCNPGKSLNHFCEHTAATLQFLLEEKTLIGLAAEPDMETPPELLSEKNLRERAKQVLRDLTPIERTKWDLIILDEGQRIKNWEAKTSRAVKALKSPYALVLSGTPMENRLDELYSVVQFVDDRRLLPAYRFFHRHRIVEDSGRVAGYKNLDELREQLSPILLRRTKESVSLQLPERATEIVRVAPTDEQMEIHNGHMQTVAAIVRKAYISEMDLLRLQKALLAARMSADSTFLVTKTEPAYSSKLDRLTELLGELLGERDRKIVLFSEWTTMLDMISPILDKNGADFVRLDGQVPQKKRQALVQQFMNDPGCRVFVTTNAGSVGLNLQAANTVVNVDLPWNPAILEQRIGRAHRMGQKRHVQVYLMVTEQTIEEQMLATLSAKHDLALAALDIGSDVSTVVMKSGVEELKRRLEVLLGAKPAAPEDRTDKAAVEETAELLRPRDEKQERIAQAGSEIVESIFRFVGTLTQQAALPDAAVAREVIPLVQKTVSEAVRLETDADGKTKVSFTLPEKPVLEGLLQGAMKWLGTLTGGK